MSLDLSVDPSRDLTLELCTFLTGLRYEDLPDDVVYMAKASILNSIGCGLSSSPSSLPSAAKLYEALEPTSKSPRDATVLAVREKATVDDAAILNGLMMTARFFDDTHLETLSHPSGPPCSAIMAFAEAKQLSGKEMILAFIIGVEVGLGLTKALGLGPYKKGWHLTGIVGAFSSAAAVACLMKLDASGMATALGHASSMAAGSRNVFATDTLIVHAGLGARNGILAARLASKGLSSTTNALEKWINLMSVAGDDSHPEKILDVLHPDKNGKRPWTLLENAFKPYPCGIVIHPLIDAGIQFHKEVLSRDTDPRLGSDMVQKIEVTVSPMTIRLCGIVHPKDYNQTMFSNYHGLSVGLIYGAGGISQFSTETANDPAVKAMRDRITLKPDASYRDNQAIVKIWYTTPETTENVKKIIIDYALGSLENPMKTEHLNAKFEAQALEGNLDQNNIREAISQLWDLDKVTNVQRLMRLLTP